MANRHAPPRLGRGLAALLGDTMPQAAQAQASVMRSLPIDQIDANPFQPRTNFTQEELESLADSIRVQGVLQPIMVRPHPTAEDRYQIVAGERRFRAAMLAGLTEIPAMQKEVDDSDAAIIALVENLQRQDLNALEEAEGFQRLIGDFGLTQEALGYAVSKSRGHIGNTVRLLKLSEPIKKEIRTGALTSGHARALVNAPDPEKLAALIIKRGLSVRQTESIVSKAAQAQGLERRSARKRPDVLDLERQVSQAIGCHVSIVTNRKGGGEIKIQFTDSLQLEELIDRLKHAPGNLTADANG